MWDLFVSNFTTKSHKPVQRETELLSLIHIDLGDLIHVMTRGGKQYYIIFANDFSMYTKLFLLRNKNKALAMLIKYKTETKNQLERKIKRRRLDRGREFKSNPFNDFYQQNVIIHETTIPYSREQNDIIEMKKIRL